MKRIRILLQKAMLLGGCLVFSAPGARADCAGAGADMESVDSRCGTT